MAKSNKRKARVISGPQTACLRPPAVARHVAVASKVSMGIEQKTANEDRAFIRLLGRLLGEVIREQHGKIAYDLVEDIRRQSVGDYRAGQGEKSLDRLLGALSQPDMLLLIRAFSIFS